MLAGIHGEGGTFSTLFCLFFWDIIFKDVIPDTFHSPYQSFPLDYYTDHFYFNRKDMVDERLERILNSSEEVTCILLLWHKSIMEFFPSSVSCSFTELFRSFMTWFQRHGKKTSKRFVLD